MLQHAIGAAAAFYVESTLKKGDVIGISSWSATLLAMVDASVGGKNGVNFGGYKNMVGVFNQPDFVICDMALLKSLTIREVLCGFAEIIKHGAIADGSMLDFIETHRDAALELARRGFRVTGVDRTRLYLERAARRAREEGLEVELVREDMRRFRRPEAFAAAVNLFTSFGYFDDDGYLFVMGRIDDVVNVRGHARLIRQVHAPEQNARVGRRRLERDRGLLTRVDPDARVGALALDRPLQTGRYVLPIYKWNIRRVDHAKELHYPETLPIFGDWPGWLSLIAFGWMLTRRRAEAR